MTSTVPYQNGLFHFFSHGFCVWRAILDILNYMLSCLLIKSPLLASFLVQYTSLKVKWRGLHRLILDHLLIEIIVRRVPLLFMDDVLALIWVVLEVEHSLQWLGLYVLAWKDVSESRDLQILVGKEVLVIEVGKQVDVLSSFAGSKCWLDWVYLFYFLLWSLASTLFSLSTCYFKALLYRPHSL